MKSLQSLSKWVDQWWRMYVTNAPQQRQPGNPAPSVQQTPGTNVPLLAEAVSGEKSASKIPPTAFFLLAVASLTSSFGYRLYSTPQLREGTLAPETIVAPQTATVIDTKATEEKRKSIRSGSYTVLKIDLEVDRELIETLDDILMQGNYLRRQAELPYLPELLIPAETQRYLRQLSEPQWQQMKQLLDVEQTSAPGTGETPSSDGIEEPQPPSPALGQTPIAALNALEELPTEQPEVGEEISPSMGLAIAQLRRIKQESSPVEWEDTLLSISKARKTYESVVRNLNSGGLSNNSSAYTSSVLEWSKSTWVQTEIGIDRAMERILTQGLAEGLPERQISAAVSLHVRDLVPASTQPFARRVLNEVLKDRHNLVHDKEAASQLAEQAAEAVPDIEYPVNAGEIIVNKGDTISTKQFVLIDYFELSQRQINWEGLMGYALLISGGVGIFCVVGRRVAPGMRQRDRILILLLTLSAPLLVAIKLPSMTLSASGLLLGGFYGSALATTVVGLTAIVLPIGMDVTWNQWLASAAGGLLAGMMAGRMRSREEAALLGMGVGVTQGAVYLFVTLIQTAVPGITWQPLLIRAALQGFAGVASSIAALGLSPYLEHLFDLVTPVRLAEISNPNRPLLQRLAAEAPGTFQHTLFVSTLAEAATRTLGGNCELVRAGTLYHDIGKMHDPLGFIENQMGGPNKHDEIKDPWKSAAIIKKHVSEGLVLAKQYRLPKAVRAFIPEHQGSMLIAFFYYQAKQMGEKDPTLQVQESDFRYPGPIPQSRETGIVMLADSCEAALRSLKEATYEEALAMVNKILKARWQDNQLVDSGLTREEMPIIADTFVRVWQQFNHKRIAYPKGALPK
ncbi:HD family phosphohydrolase [Roseofilum casamattae]|uniref:HDIG domain-containing protein n=1 Tax=Roseofilum casamattae BLCC-M143 TaxID=3022442 RepID=A0ABT7BZF2_9CYAN|nr:HDIG domain-containing metalloprotein [Roseofilum casamattae]MDJ1184573.1 HDIG domain-containing protein [Roseofilum casamattae BLCC-M143]